MNLFDNEQGQAIVECLLAVTIVVVIVTLISDRLLIATKENTKYLKVSREAIWQRLEDPEIIKLSNNYRLNRGVGRMIYPLNNLTAVELESRNLRVMTLKDNNTYNMVRLTNSWNSKEYEDLTKRPAALVLNNVLSGDLTRTVQGGISQLFLAKELKTESLIFGHIDPDIIPEEALIER